ncbi:Rib/alpha-like domain-containing protein [Corynebacterium pyruviciproducens]
MRRSRPRGFSIAAAAVSLTMVLPGLVPAQPPQAVAQEAPAADAGASKDAKPQPDMSDAPTDPQAVENGFYSGAIDSPGVKDAKGTVNGRVVKMGMTPTEWIADAVTNGTPLGGIEVYAQWTEKNKKGQISSPVYKTTTAEDGSYSIALKPYKDANGKEHTFEADPTAAFKEKVQLWFRAPNDNEELFWAYGYRPVPDGIVADTTGGASWTGGRVRGANAIFKAKEDPSLPNHKPKDQWVTQPPENMEGNNGDINGRIYWNWVQGVGSLRWQDVNNPNHDRGIPNVQVVASYLSDEAVNQIEAYYNEHKADFNNHPLRGKGWTPQDQKKLNDWIMEQVKAHPEWIAETVQTVTDAKGNYKIRFNGTYGMDNRKPGKVPADKVGKVAGSPNEGSWGDSGLSKDTKHVNWNWMYVSTPNMPRVAGVTTPWRNENWGGSKYANWDPVGTEIPNGVTATQTIAADYFSPVNIGALTPHAVFDVLKYDTRKNFATPGVTVHTGATGWPSQADQKYKIVWTDPSGNEIESCEATADANGMIPTCPMVVPKDLKEVSTYNATLYALPDGDDPLIMGIDSFTAIPARLHTPYGTVGQAYPLQDPGNPENKDGKVAAFVEVPEKIGDSPVTWTYELDPTTPLPAGLTFDPKTGTITGTPTEFGTWPVKVTAVGSIPGANNETKEVRIGTTNNLTVTKATMVDYTFKEGEKGSKPITVLGLPEGVTATNFKPVGDLPAGFSLAPDGTLTVDETAKTGLYEDVTIQYDVVDKDGVTHTIQGKGKVVVTPNPALVKQDKDLYEPQAPAETATTEQGGTVTTKPLSFDDPATDATETAPAHTEFAPGKDANGNDAPSWITVDPKTGAVTATPGTDVKPGVYQVPVTVTYPDGTSDTVNVPVEVTKRTPDAERHKAAYPSTPTSVAQDSTGTVTEPSFDDPSTPDVTETVPNGTKFGPGKGADGKETPSWVTVDPDTGRLTVKPDTAVTPGTYRVPVQVTYPDGSTATIYADVEVTKKELTQAQASVPAYPQATEVSQGGEAKVPVTFDRPRTSETETMPEGTTFAPGTAVPAWATVDPKTGELTVKPGKDVPVGEYTVPVEVTYPDKSHETVNVPVKVTPYVSDADKNKATYPAQPTVVGKDAEKTVPAPTGVNGAPLPKGTTFAPGAGAPTWATVNPDGSVTLKPGADIKPGEYKVPVVVTYPDGSTQTVEVPVTVLPTAAAAEPTAPAITPVNAGEEATTGPLLFDDPSTPDTEKVPAGTTFAKGEGAPDWATVNSDGSVTVRPGKDVPAGTTEIPVVVTYADGSTDTVKVPVKVNPYVKQADKTQPSYPKSNTTVQAGQETTVPKPTFDTPAPEGTKYEPGEGVPSWATVNPDGSISIKPGKDVTPGDYTVPVKVTYPDGSTDIVKVPVTVTEAPKDAAVNKPRYSSEDLTAEAGKGPVTGTAPSFDDPTTADKVEKAPAGTTFAKGTAMPDGTPVPSWATVDPATGAVTANPPAGTQPGTYKIPVVVTYPDGSTDEGTVAVVVTKEKDAATYQPAYETTEVTQGTPAKVAAPKGENGKDLPAGTTYAPGKDVPSWAKVNPDGTITVSPDATVPAGRYNIPVEVTYPDGSKEIVMVPVNVTEAAPTKVEDKDSYDPIAPAATTVEPGKSTTTPAPTWANDKTPAGTPTYTLGTDAPKWATVDPATGAVTANPPADTQPGTYNVPVVVTYPDNTTDTFYVPVTVAAPAAKKTQAQQSEPRYKANDNAVEAGTTVKSTAPSFDDPTTPATETKPERTKFSFEGPDWITVDPATGQATIAPGADVKPDTYPGTVKATYDDGSTDEIPVKVTVLPTKDSHRFEPSPASPGASVAAGETKPNVTAVSFDDPATPAKEAAPDRTTYQAGADAPKWVTVNPDGTFTLAPGKDVKPGTYNVPVVVTYPDHSTETVTIPVTVTPRTTDAEALQPRYASTPVTAGEKATVPAPLVDGKTAPSETSYKAGDGVPSWATVNPDGSVSLAPGKDVKPGTYKIPVVVTYPDGSSETIEVPVTVGAPAKQADKLSPRVDTASVPGGTLSEAPVIAGEVISMPTVFPGAEAPAGTTYTGDPANPSWVTVSPSGGVTAVPPADAKPGRYPVKVLVTYPDGSTDVIETTIVVKARPQLTPNYGPAHPVKAGEKLVIDPPTVDNPFTEQVERLPGNTTFALGKDAPSWATVDRATGAVTATPGENVEPKTYEIPVEVTIGGQTKTVKTQVTVVVTKKAEEATLPDARKHQPQYPAKTPRVTAGKDGSVAAPSFDDPTTDAVEETPEKVSFAPTDETPAWVKVDLKTGALTLAPGADVAPGGYLVPVKVTYADGSSEVVSVPVIVEKPKAERLSDANQPAYPASTPMVFAGKQATVLAPSFDNPATEGTETAPAGTTFTLGKTAPTWVTIDPTTGALTLTPGADVPAGTYQIPIVVTYPDGSTDTVYQDVAVVVSGLSYAPTKVGDKPVTLPLVSDKELPAGATFKVTELPTGWENAVTVDPKTGALTVDAPKNAKPGTYSIMVTEYINGAPVSAAVATVTVPEELNIPAIVGGVLGGLAVLGGGAWALSQLGIIPSGSDNPGSHAKPEAPAEPETTKPDATKPGDQPGQQGKGDGKASEPIRSGDKAPSNAKPGKHAKKDLASTGVQYVQIAALLGALSLLIGAAFIALRRRRED